MTIPDAHPLGSTGLAVSPLALGSWRTFERMPRRDAVALIRHAHDRGINFFDDARYDDETGVAPLASGYSEVLFGEIFRAAGLARDGNVVSNKLWWEHWPRQNAVEELDESLGRMGFDHVDLIYAVTLPDGLGVEEAVGEVAGLIGSGRARAWGVANWSAEDLHAAAAAAEWAGISPPLLAQLPYSLIDRASVENPEMDAALEAAGAGLVPSNVLGGGVLTGKYSAPSGSAEPPSGRLAAALDDLGPELEAAVALNDLARQLGTASAALAIAFTLAHPRTASVLVGATAPSQIDQNLAAIEVLARLSEADLERLRRVAGGAAGVQDHEPHSGGA